MSRHRRRRKNPAVREQMYKVLTAQFNAGFGVSRHEAKADPETEKGLIHSKSTYMTYRQQCYQFANYIKANYPDDYHKTLADVRQYVPGYLQSLIDAGKKPDTVQTARAALSKLYGADTKEWGIDIPRRSRANITRSRNDTVMDTRVNDKSREMYGSFLRCCGLRRREITALKGGSLIEGDDGKYYVKVSNGKGGKVRTVEVIGSPEEQEAIASRIRETADGVHVFPKPPDALDIHAYRAEYAGRFYRMIARPIEEVPREERYYCRGDKKGEVYDRKALEIVSQNLGHERVSVMVNNYLWQ